MKRFKDLILKMRNLLEWFIPFFIFLILIILIKLFFRNINLNELLKIIVWPVTILVILFFFKQVVTYLFFSMDEFNFFGAKGNLKNVNDVIAEEVEKKFMEEKEEQKRKKIIDKLNTDINIKENEINEVKGTARENLELAKEIVVKWKKSTEENIMIINDLARENKRLREITPSVSASSSVSSANIKIPEIGSGEKTNDLTLGNPK